MKKSVKKIMAVILTAVIGVGLLAGCSSTGSSSNDESLSKVKKAGVLKVGLSDDYPPMEFRDSNNKVSGFDIDMINAIGKKMGVKVQIVTNSFDGIFVALKAKKFDMVQSCVSITDERKSTLLFSDPYIYGGVAVFVKKSNTTIKKPEDLKGKVVGCQAGTTAEDALKKFNGLKETKKYQQTTDAFLDLENNRIEAVVADPMVGDYYTTKNPGKYEKISKYLGKEPVGAAFRKQDKTLKDAYQKAYNELKKDGTLSKLSNKWFGYDIYSSQNK
ncbi:polar amino acid transport system substrate-binding protein [Clostridium acetobutylicum]|uniref:Periplasmic amino acid-binding protein n=1 Tax=Clostridium acetobutylicum (strain ATCC 824 / DSM 792 / JCM 1419 / IAM 19013 / LMG 5710 / NBRC 13948 / NRRL B-527 / VKM B-1787 / 2291 / W) TaxID=272562 RepID=Q97M20_CLOAB|nr:MULTISPECIES: ABC transporter substrate-binding protein [Clostridium]AAK78360.1 Periplasmic amino acid-binding protein [Clostridium acetobutylicum ATCC 824]ADZ19429.1 Periplasmic amino acid-binding protein [Clostridium acetobutylicum EA 2018]AEI31208.1 periplasmic amino acid-binding protein [Clostridium acetobutylicum DSM 1731]AWV80084.1 amino acid ABC transporter substrate-binding protein [Clostridium acetobutylicum]MBC2395906.1 amino acid ABC transporter substrate-binding protein [Clostri